MPQMAPMLWFILFFYFLFLSMFMKNVIFFNQENFMYLKNKYNLLNKKIWKL